MKRILLPILFAGILLLSACEGATSVPVDKEKEPSQAVPSPSSEYENVAAVVAALDKHTMSNGIKPYYELIGAYDGMKYDVEPGGYRLEIYVYRDSNRLTEMARQAETVDNQVHIEGNAMLLLHTTDESHLDRLLADLRD
jgi:hypothetical protein